MSKKKFTSVVEIVIYLRKLRSEVEVSAASFMWGLYNIERGYGKFLHRNGCPTFASFLVSYDLCSPRRYAEFKAGLDMLKRARQSENVCLVLGEPATAMVARIRNPDRLKPFIQLVHEFKERHHGNVPTRPTAKSILESVEPPLPREVGPSLRSRLAKAEAELQLLKIENRDLRTEIRQLKQQLDKRRGSRATARDLN